MLRLVLPVLLILGAIQTAEGQAQFTVHPDRVITEHLVGFGAQMNPYLYARPNWGDVTEENVKDLERKVLDLAPQHTRILCLADWWTPAGDPNIAKGENLKQSLIRTLRLAQQAGATVNLQLWYGPIRVDPENLADRFAGVIEDLVRNHGITAIQYSTLQNEVNDGHKITMRQYNRLYRAFDHSLRRRGLRDQIQIVGGDLVSTEQQTWFANLAEHQMDMLDGYSVHIYWDYWDTAKLLRRVSEVPPIVASLPPEARKPLYITEFGIRGHREQYNVEPGKHEDGIPIARTTLHGVQIAWFMLEAINRGYVATVQWDAYDAWYDRLMGYGVIGPVKEGWPLKPSYHVLRLFTHTVKPGWQTLTVEGKSENAIVSVMRGPDGELTVLALNRADQAQTISVGGLPRDASLHVTIWNADGQGQLAHGEPVTCDKDGVVQIDVSAGSLTALTTQSPKL